MSKGPLVLIGNTGTGVEILETATILGFEVIEYNPPDFVNGQVIPREHFEYPAILGYFSFPENAELRFDRLTIENRLILETLAKKAGFWNWTSIVHPSAVISPSTSLGVNAFINANATVANNSTIGDNVWINRNASIGHDVAIGDFCRIGPSTVIPGLVVLKERVTTGPGVVMINFLTIGKGATVAAGSVVTKDIAAGLLVFGSPATSKRSFRVRTKRILKNVAKRILLRLGFLGAVRKRRARS